MLIIQRTHLHMINPLHASAITNTRDPVSAAVQVATHTGFLPATALHTGKGGVCPQTHYGNATSTMEECDLRKGRNADLLQDLHLHKGGPTRAHWCLPCQAYLQLHSAAFPCCNTLKHKKTYTPISTHLYLLQSQSPSSPSP